MAVIPEQYRAAIQTELDALVGGERPGVMTWVTAYPARLVVQPELIWSHARSEVVERGDGTAFCVLPLWTTVEAPSDLSIELDIDSQGTATITDLRVQ